MDVIFDVDGTLVNIEHRVPLIRPTDGSKKDWNAFRAAAIRDVSNDEIVLTAIALHKSNHRLIVCTGRMEKERGITLGTLLGAGFPCGFPMYMRPNDDVRPDHVIKLEMLAKLKVDGYNPIMVFDDRQQVVDMWRAQGLRVCQVAPGNF